MENSIKNDYEKMCFFITPIGTAKSEARDRMEALKSNILIPILEELNMNLEIAHTIDEAGSITDQIFERIVKSKLVIVDLTGLNPNVMYELAVRHSFDRPCVVICENTTKLPFDLLADRTVFFENSIKGAGELKEELRKKVKVALSESGDNPVVRAVTKSNVLNNINDSSPDAVILKELYMINDRLNDIEIRLNTTNERNKIIHYHDKGYNKSEERIIRNIIKMKTILKNDLDREPSPAEIAAELDIPIEVVSEILDNVKYKWTDFNKI